MVSGQRHGGQAEGAGRRFAWFARLTGGTNGAAIGMSGGLAPVLLAVGGFIALVDAVNVLTVLHDAARRGHPLAAWEVITWEATSGIAEFAVCGLITLGLRAAPPLHAAWWRTLAVHLGASVVFSAGHVGLMLALRDVVYAAAGRHYHWDAGDIPYEYRKDVLAYLVLALIFQRFSPRPAAAAAAAAPRHFDITDGARVTRARLETIMAISSAGNYAEFHLSDGTTRLMRVTLRTLEAELGAQGFERTHRSWLVNARAVVALQPAGSGDFTITLAGGVTAPLSRRFPQTLARLRAGTPP